MNKYVLIKLRFERYFSYLSERSLIKHSFECWNILCFWSATGSYNVFMYSQVGMYLFTKKSESFIFKHNVEVFRNSPWIPFLNIIREFLFENKADPSIPIDFKKTYILFHIVQFLNNVPFIVLILFSFLWNF